MKRECGGPHRENYFLYGIDIALLKVGRRKKKSKYHVLTQTKSSGRKMVI